MGETFFMKAAQICDDEDVEWQVYESSLWHSSKRVFSKQETSYTAGV